MYIFVHKLKAVKLNVKHWNRVRRKYDGNVNKLETDFNTALLATDNDPTDVNYYSNMLTAAANLRKVLNENYVEVQKSKINWL